MRFWTCNKTTNSGIRDTVCDWLFVVCAIIESRNSDMRQIFNQLDEVNYRIPNYEV
jgi:hypothetical protein